MLRTQIFAMDDDSSQQILDWIDRHRITEVECLVPDIAGIPRGKILPVGKYIDSLKSKSLRLPQYIFGQTVTGTFHDSAVLPATDGDMMLTPHPHNCYLVPWYSEPTAQIIHDAFHLDGRDVAVAPRTVLKRVLALFSDRGWRPIIAPELEFFLVAQSDDPDHPLKTPVGRSGKAETGGQAFGIDAVNDFDPFFEDVYDHCEAMGLDIDTLSHETGAAQMEINFNHGDALALADQVLIFKRTVRQTALNHNIHATFMAKPIQYQPGSSMHLHCSVLNEADQSNIFSQPDGAESEMFRYALGGLQRYLAGGMAIMAPYVNSYRRLATTYNAPTNLAWGYDNRTVGLRVPLGDDNNRRIENRIPGADTNPYLCIALTLASIYLGIEQKLTPTKPMQKEQDGVFSLPRNLDVALDKLNRADEIRSLLGDDFVTVFSEVKRAEAEAFLDVISPWERQYLLLNV